MECKICGGESKFLFKKQVLQKHNVSYFRCKKCFFMFTEEPFWIDEAYSRPFTITDVGLLDRILRYGKLFEEIILRHFDRNGLYLDYGGGNGLFTRYMRDLGINFYHYDKHAANVYANHFDIVDIVEKNPRIELITALEVFEHLQNPLSTLDELFSKSNNILFTTFLQPKVKDLNNWWYISSIHGQHISFYHRATLSFLAKKYNKFLYTNNREIHLLCEKRDLQIKFELDRILEPGPVFLKNKLISLINKTYRFFYPPVFIERNPSLTNRDFEYLNSKYKELE